MARSIDLSAPFSRHFMPDHPNMPAGIVGGLGSIAVILKSLNVSQISDSVIGANAVDVVYLMNGPSPVVDCPCDPMQAKGNTKNMRRYIPISANRTNFPSGVFCVPHFDRKIAHPIAFAKEFRVPFIPKKLSGLWLIAQQLTEKFRGNIGSVSHGAVPLRSGQGRRLFAQLFRPASYDRITLCSQVKVEFCQ